MNFSENPHDALNLEQSPEQHDAEAIEEGSTESDTAFIHNYLSVEQKIPLQDCNVLDIGCGTGRHVRALTELGYRSYGLDADQRMIIAAQQEDPKQTMHYHCGDVRDAQLPSSFPTYFNVVCLFNNSLTCFHSHDLAWGLFSFAAQHLKPGGFFIIDNSCHKLWDEVRSGNFGDGVSIAGDEQLFFLPGDNRFVWRRGKAVNIDSWQAEPGDRIYRMWSLSEIALAAAGTGLASLQLGADTAFIVLQRPLDS